MKKIFLKSSVSFLLIFICAAALNGQVKKERVGADELEKTGLNYYNYSEKDRVNIEVSLWGFVKSPGRYLLPMGSTFTDLFTLCGGPQSDARLTDIRIVRLKNDSLNIKEDKVIELNYNDFLLEDKITTTNKLNPVLYPGDIIIVPGSTKSAFKENFSLILTAITTITSVAVLLVTVFRNN